MFILIDRQSLILKNGGKKSFSYEDKAIMSFIAMRRMSLKILLCESVFVPTDKQTLTLKNEGKRTSFMKPKHQFHLFQRGK